ncbi:MAG: M48 family metalloprotease [Bacteroidota bacterium]
MLRTIIPYRHLVLTALVLGLSFFWDGCAVNPVSGKKQFMLMSESQELALGKQSDPSIVAQFGMYQDDQLQSFLNEKGQEMAKVSHRPDLAFEFKLLDSPVVNAFALPGGYVYFTRGIMAHFNNEAQFAGVLGHEIGHVTARHSARQYSRSVLAQVGLIAGMIISPEFAQFGNEASQAMQLLLLKYGRDAESESDKLGVEYSSQVGYDAHQMAGFFGTLDRLTGGAEGRLPTFMSTHPDPADRNQKVDQMAGQWQRRHQGRTYEVGRESYLRMIDGLMYGEDPRQGFVERNNFYHPELKFQYPIPAGWRTANSPQQVQMAPEDGKAVILLQLGQGQTLEAAAQAVAEKYNLRATGSQRRTVNGLSALEVYADLVQQAQDANGQTVEQILKTVSYYIQYGDLIYHFLGVSSKQDFASYRGRMLSTMTGFRTLSDPDKLNRQAERLKIQELDRDMTVREAFAKYQQPSDRHEELAILNGMELTTRLRRGTLIKTVFTPSGQ